MSDRDSDTQFTFSEDSCIICKKGFGNDGPKVSMREKGIQTVIESCKRYKDNNLLQYLLSQPQFINVHANCRRDYVRTDRPCQFSAENPNESAALVPAKKLRSSTESLFKWEVDCFFCGQNAVPDVRHPE